MNIDVVFLSNALNERLQNLTIDAIKSCVDNAANYRNNLNIYVNEGQSVDYLLELGDYVSEYLVQEKPFNFNNEFNRAAKLGQGDYILFCNNDLVFKRGWDVIFTEMQKWGYRSASPFCPITHRYNYKMKGDKVISGWKIAKYFAGWCFAWKRSLFEQLGGLRTNFPGWYSDNETVEQLKENSVKHYLIPYGHVIHLTEQTKRSITDTKEKKRLYYDNLKEKFKKMYPNQKQVK